MSAYLTEIRSILKNAASEIDSTPCKSAIISISGNPYFTELGKTKFIANIRNRYYYIIDEASEAISTAFNEYVKRLDDLIRESKENNCVDHSDLAILSSELISLSESEFLKIAQKHKDNYSMYEAISNYAKLHKVHCPINFVSRNKKIQLAQEIRDKAIHKLDDIFYMPLFITIDENTEKILIE